MKKSFWSFTVENDGEEVLKFTTHNRKRGIKKINRWMKRNGTPNRVDIFNLSIPDRFIISMEFLEHRNGTWTSSGQI